jgi:tRNA-splicing ligase RtcB
VSNQHVWLGEPGRPIKAWIQGVELEAEAEQQLRNVASLPFIYKHVAVMPDVHWGMGATVGSVIPTKGAIVPAAVGVDIGCGMMAARTNLTSHDLPENLRELRIAIERAVPVGRTDDGGANDRGSWGDVPTRVRNAWRDLLAPGYDQIVKTKPEVLHKRCVWQLGTLGTGNHFIELCLDELDRVWIMLHSGSRGAGNRIGSVYIGAAKREAERWHIPLPDPNLAYLPEDTELFREYTRAVAWAQEYARINRQLMMGATFDAVCLALGRSVLFEEEAVNCHHNYVARENHFGENVWVTRKGAVRAREGDLGIIPGSMGARSYIVRGKGCADSFHSCSHGAGRRMSRGAAKKAFTVDDHVAATAGVECRKDEGVLDETPGAYKNIDAVMAAQSELVDVVHTLKQIVCVKG